MEIIPYDPDNKWIRKGPSLPEESVNLAYVHSPDLSPKDYLDLIDESISNPKNQYSETIRKKVMYSGLDGCLESYEGHQIIDDEYPTVTDQFYDGITAQENILPYVHISRFYHIDAPGLVPRPTGESDPGSYDPTLAYRGSKISLVDEVGEPYEGKYQIELAHRGDHGSQTSYRVHLFLDDMPSRTYSLVYNKGEINENILPNGNLENYVGTGASTDWQDIGEFRQGNGGVEAHTSDKYSGLACAKMTLGGGGADIGGIVFGVGIEGYPREEIDTSQTYILSAKVKKISGIDGAFLFRIRQYDDSVGGLYQKIIYPVDYTSGSSEWEEVSGIIYPFDQISEDDYWDQSAAYVSIDCWIQGAGISAEFLVDDVQLAPVNGQLHSLEHAYNEIISPQPTFLRSYDLNDVLDPQNEDLKLFFLEHSGSTYTSAGAIMGEGGRAFVTKKAIPDPRNFQFFHWRVKGTYTFNTQNDYSITYEDLGVINVGYLVFTDYKQDIRDPDHFCFYNLQNWGGNIGIQFNNPHPTFTGGSTPPKTSRYYWEVNLDQLDRHKIDDYDLLVLSTHDPNFSFNSRHKSLIKDFIKAGGILLLEDCGGGKVSWGSTTTSSPVYCAEGYWTSTDITDTPLRVETGSPSKVVLVPLFADTDSFLYNFIDARKWGGYQITDAECDLIGDKIHQYWSNCWTDGTKYGAISYIKNLGTDWHALIGKDDTPDKGTLAVYDPPTMDGYILLSTMDILCGVNDLWDEYSAGGPSQEHHLNSYSVPRWKYKETICGICGHAFVGELGTCPNGCGSGSLTIVGVTKDEYMTMAQRPWADASCQLLFNIALMSCANRQMDDALESRNHTVRFSAFSDWKPSWAIHGDALEEWPLPNEKIKYDFFHYKTLITTCTDCVVGTDHDDNDVYRTFFGTHTACPWCEGSNVSTTDRMLWAKAIAAEGERDDDGIPLSKTCRGLVWKNIKCEQFKANPERWDEVYVTEITNEKVYAPQALEFNDIPVAWTIEPTPTFRRGTDYPANHRLKSREEASEGYGGEQYVMEESPQIGFSFSITSEVIDPEKLEPCKWRTTGKARTHYGEQNFNARVDDIYVMSLNLPNRFAYTSIGNLIGRETYPSNSPKWAVSYVQDAFNHMIWKKQNPWTTAPADHCTVDGIYGDQMKSFVQSFEDAYFAAGIPHSEGDYIDAAMFEAITSSLTYTNYAGIELSAVGNHFYQDSGTLAGEFTTFHGRYDSSNSNENDSQSIPADYPDTTHRGHPFALNHAAYGTPWNMVDSYEIGGRYTCFGARTNMDYQGDLFADQITISFDQEVRLNRIVIKPYLPKGWRDAGVYYDIHEIVTWDEDGNRSVCHHYSHGNHYYLTDESNTTIWISSSHRKVKHMCIGITALSPVARHGGSGKCFAWGITNLEAWGPVTLEGELWDIYDEGIITLYSGQKESIYLVPHVAGEELPNVYSLAWATINTEDFPDGYSGSFDSSSRYLVLNTLGASGEESDTYSKAVSASEGIKILKDYTKTPPRVLPFPRVPDDLLDGTDEGHAVTFRINRLQVPRTVTVGFYDKRANVFLFDADGDSAISGRTLWEHGGPSNVVIAAIADYKSTLLRTNMTIAVITEGPPVPFRWAMPPFGLVKEIGSKIQVKELPPALTAADSWPIPISRGHLTKTVMTRTKDERPYRIKLPSGVFLDTIKYPTVYAHYNISEADQIVWSTVFGEPYWDIESEKAKKLDSYIIQINYPPIHAAMLDNPTAPTAPKDIIATDTYTPCFIYGGGSPYTNGDPSIFVDGNQLDWENIEDYDLQNGIVYLKSTEDYPLAPLTNQNEVLITYVSASKYYYFRYNDEQFIDLNPMYGHSCKVEDEVVDTLTLVNKPLLVYLLPALLSEPEGMMEEYEGDFAYYNSRRERLKVIPGSYRDWTLYITRDRTQFDASSHNYNPLAMLLATIYINPKISTNDVSLLDARQRGGGFREELSFLDCKNMYEEADACWDLGHLVGETYPKTANVIIRVPGWLEHYFTSAEVSSIINKLVPSGILWKVEYCYTEEEDE